MKDGSFTPLPTADGSSTFFSEEFQETFHSSFGAKQEAEVRYIQPCQLKQLAVKKNQIRILDICYGLGYNSAAALEAIWSVNPECFVELVALEISAAVPRQAISYQLLEQWQPFVSKRLAQLLKDSSFQDKYLKATLVLGDARQTIQTLTSASWKANAVFLDPFSPPKCPQLWTVEFIGLIAQCLAESGKLATYSCSAAVRSALLTADFSIASIAGAGRKSPGTLAELRYKKTLDISIKEREHLKTRAAVPYRDFTLTEQAEIICARRLKEQEVSNLESTSQWRKRWQG